MIACHDSGVALAESMSGSRTVSETRPARAVPSEFGEPAVEIGAGNEPVWGFDHSDGAAGVGDVNFGCGCGGRDQCAGHERHHRALLQPRRAGMAAMRSNRRSAGPWDIRGL